MKTITSSRVINLPVILILCCVSALILTSTVNSKGPGRLRADKIKAPVLMFDVGLGPHTFKVQMGRDTESHYLGGSPLQQALQAGRAQPRTMVSEDFNGDGMGDLIVGYANNGSGILSFRIGNVQAIAPTDHEAFEGVQQGRYPAPFLPEARLYSLPEAPDFLQIGDFNADGYQDVLAAARGGATLYLLASDGRGNLGAIQEFPLSGSLTALQANDSRQPGVFTSLAVGLRTDEGTRALIYNQAGGGFAGEPESYSMPGDVTAFAFGRLDEDSETDLAAATTNQLLVIHGRGDQSADAQRTPAVETESLPFVIRGLAVGDFVWDRNHEREIAALSDDGTVYLSARGNPDTRPYTKDELKTLRDLKRSYTYGKIDMETFRAESNKLVRANRGTGWNVSETISTGAVPASNSFGQALFQRLDASNLPTDDLLIGNGLNNHLQLVRNERDATKLGIEAKGNLVDLNQIPADSAPVAAVSMRLSIDSRPGTVVLQGGGIEPVNVILSPDATFIVNSNADLADTIPTAADATCLASNGLCTLRAAIMQSNHTGGSNAITVPDNTYTINLGAPDDEANTFGATEQSGDLDIFNWNAFDGSPTLTAVTINGTSRDGTIISMGTFPSTVPTNVPNNKERILEVNDGVTVQSKINVTLNNLTMQNGVEPTGSGTFLDGGAIWYDGADATATTNVGLLTLHNVKLTGNTSAGSGGGVHAQFGSLKIESTSIIRANTSQHKVGGGVEYNGGNTTNETQFLSVDNSTIGGALVADGNQAIDATFGAGGGLDTRGGGLNGAGIVISGGTLIQNNIAHSVNGLNGGGGIQIGNGPFFAFSSSTISNNSAKNHAGGLLSNAITLGGTNATITLTSMTISGNTADSENNGTGDGGGIYNFAGSLVITGTSHIDGNTAVNGGGIFNTWNGINTGANLTMTGGTIGQAGAGNGNNAKNNGGGFAINPGAPGTPGIINLNTVSIANNTANSDSSGGGDGGGIFVATANLSSLNGSTIDSNVANSGTGDGIFMSGGTITAAGALTLSGDDSLNINGGTFTSTAGTFNLAGNFTRATGGTFTHNSGTVNFNGSGAQNINGTATSESFNNFTVNKSAGTLTVGGSTTALFMAGTVTLSAGTFAAGTATTIGLTGNGGNWTNNGGTFTPGSSVVSFTNTVGPQAINGSNASQTFNSITMAKTAQTLSVAGSTTTLNLNGTMLLTSGTFSAGTAANINVGTDWTNNGGTFTPGSGTVTFNGGAAQNLNGSAATQTFNNFGVNKGGGTLTVGGSTTTLNVNTTTLTAGTFAAGTAAAINVGGDWTNNGGTFTPGAGTVTFNNTAAAQSLNGSNASQTFNSITVAKTAQTLSGAGNLQNLTLNGTMLLTSGTFAVGTITGINVGGNWTNNGGTFTPGSSTVTFNSTTAAQNLNGTAASQTFNNLTVSKSGQTLTGGGSTTTLTLNGNFNITAGTFAVGTATAMNVAGNWANGGTFTPGAGTVTFNGNNNTQTLTGTTSFNNLTSNHTGTGSVTASGSSLTVTGLLRIQAGTFTSSSNLNNVQIDSGTTLASDGSTMNVSGNWTNNGGTFTPSTGTVNFNGGAAQAINGTATSQTFNNLTVNKTGTLSVAGSTTSLTASGVVTLTAGTFAAGTAATITAAGNWTNNGGTFTPGTGTVDFTGGAGQTIGGTTATTFNNLTNSNASGLSLTNDNTVNGVLALTSSDITVAATKTLTQPVGGSSSGGNDVNGRVQRSGFVTGGGALSFGNTFNTIQVTAGTAPANIVVDLARSVPLGSMGYPTAVQRTYTITPSASGFTGTLRLHYKTGELNGNDPTLLNLWRFDATLPTPGWRPNPATSRDCAAGCTSNTSSFWVERTGVTTFSPWTLNSTNAPSATGGVVTGRTVDQSGNPVEGAVVRLNGTQNRKFITDANGFYRFENVETNGFYIVTPSRANYTFSPSSRSFSQIGESTEATFGATLASGGFVNPLDTPEYFVRQHYLDFLGREPDEAGFNFWSDQILECGNDNQCIERRRENVSAAYFLSIEFQQTGGLVDGLYKASYGVRPQFAEFMPDTRAVGLGVVVGTEGWEAKLQANKEAFVAAFVNRPAFHAAYDGLSSSDYVDALISHAGVSFTSGERDALVSGLANGTLTRSAALRSIAENNRFVNAKFNETFVMMEYFGYLRRDADASGYAFWLNKLSEFNGNFERAEMVKAFIVSGEFRDRFPR